MLGLVLGFLTAIAPLITSAGLSLINLFVSNAADKKKAQDNFLAAIQSHVNDALQSVASRNSAAQQVADLQADLKAKDDAPVVPNPDPKQPQ